MDNRAVNEAPYDGREGGYQGQTYDTFDVLDDIIGDISRRDEVIHAIRDSFDDDIWVERNMFSLNGVRKYVALPKCLQNSGGIGRIAVDSRELRERGKALGLKLLEPE